MGRKLLVLPTGFAVIVDVARRPDELRQGLQGRTRLQNTHGMLFVQPKTGVYRYWMQGVAIPLDIIWLDDMLTVVEIVPFAIPGSTVPLGTCLASKYALELAGGMAARYGLRVGHVLRAV
jgi:uncharacterized protein